MKNLFRAVAVAAVLPALALAANTAQQTVTADVSSAIDLSIISGDAVNLTLTPGGTAQPAPAVLVVSASQPYTIKASPDSDAAKTGFEAYLFEYDTSVETPGYVDSGRKLGAKLQVKGEANVTSPAAGTGTSFADIATAGTLVFTGTEAVSNGQVLTTVSQAPSWGDASLPAGFQYRMVVTYTAATTGV